MQISGTETSSLIIIYHLYLLGSWTAAITSIDSPFVCPINRGVCLFGFFVV